MDKKNIHSRQGFNKALTSENRKSTDVNKQQLWPRNARRRENPNFTNTKSDPQRNTKSIPAKTRPNVDKRPKPRGGFWPVNKPIIPSVDTTSGTRLAEDDSISDGDQNNFEIELNSVYAQGSKKQNLNHLLNFHYSPRESGNSNGHIFSRIGNKNNLKKHRYNKEQFLQANFQFVINCKSKSSISNSCPDTLIDWSLIEQINIQTTEEPQCPICLYPPVAAKLTRCGHVYCWPCILHYLALSDRTWRKCPICYDAIHIKDLKSTVIVQQSNFSVGDYIKLQLMQREKGSMFIGKIKNAENDTKIPYISAEIDKKLFSKFLLARPFEILEIIEREREELMLGLDEDCPEYVFIKQALDLLDERRRDLDEILIENNQEMNIGGKHDLDNNKNDVHSEDEETSEENSKETSEENSEEANDENLEGASGGSNEEETTSYKITKDNSKYYFYQSVDGQNIFLHPLNVKMLQATYGSLNQGPLVIEAKILQKEIQSMDDDLRKKFTCLGHLPLTCQFEIVEVQLEPPVVSQGVLEMFKDDIVARKKIRMRRAKEEMKREKEINAINERQMGKLIARSANIDIQSPEQFPTCGYESFPSTSSVGDLNFSPPIQSSPQKTKTTYASFANVLSASKKDIWPTLDGPLSPTSSHHNTFVDSRPSWVTTARNHERFSECESTDTNTEINCNIRQNLGDVIADALLNTRLEGGNNNTNQEAEMGKKKKKKNKKTLLFSTGMNFNGN